MATPYLARSAGYLQHYNIVAPFTIDTGEMLGRPRSSRVADLVVPTRSGSVA